MNYITQKYTTTNLLKKYNVLLNQRYQNFIAQSAGAVEYTDYFSAEG